MSVNLTKLIFHSEYPAFINNTEYTGSGTISGSVSPGTNTRTFNVSLDSAPDLLDVQFFGASSQSGNDPRGDDTWFRQGIIWTQHSSSSAENGWVMTSKIDGATLVITATTVRTSTGTISIDAETFNYKIVDYSVFD